MKMQDLLALPAQALKGNIGFLIFNDQDNHKPVIIHIQEVHRKTKFDGSSILAHTKAVTLQ